MSEPVETVAAIERSVFMDVLHSPEVQERLARVKQQYLTPALDARGSS